MLENFTLKELLLKEFEEELKATRRILERIPEHKLSWTPHPKSMSLGQLAFHVAILPEGLTNLFSKLIQEVPTVPLPEATSLTEILSTLDKSEATVKDRFSAWEENDLQAEWKMKLGSEIIMSAPRIWMIRTAMLNHWYHHRGQLVVYLRLLDIPIPATYGSSADEKL